MPKMEIPQWFDRVCKEDIPLFWARRKFPVVALAFVFENFNEMSIVGLFSKLSSEVNWQPVGLHLFIDGKEIFGKDYHYFRVGEEHVLLCDLRVLFNDEEWQGLDACLGDDWKAVQVDCKSDLILSQWGVYVYKQETNMEDIKFSLPNPNSSRDCMPSLLVLRTPERIIKHAREIFSLIFDEILNVIMPVEEIDTQALILLSIVKEDEASAITYGASLKQQHQGSIRELQRSLETLKHICKQLIEALFSNPEVVSIFTRRVEEILSETMAEASAVANGASLKQLFLQLLKPCKFWKEIIEIAASFPEVENLLMQLGEELRWTTKSDEASAADNGTKLKQQEEASSSQMQGLHVKEFIEEFASAPEISEVFASLPGLKHICSQLWEEIAQHGLQLQVSNMDLSNKESDDEKHAETPYNPPNQNLGETRDFPTTATATATSIATPPPPPPESNKPHKPKHQQPRIQTEIVTHHGTQIATHQQPSHHRPPNQSHQSPSHLTIPRCPTMEPRLRPAPDSSRTAVFHHGREPERRSCHRRPLNPYSPRTAIWLVTDGDLVVTDQRCRWLVASLDDAQGRRRALVG